MITLREKEINKLAAYLQLPEDQLERLHNMRLLDESIAVDILIRYEFNRLKRTGLYNVRSIITALKNEYDVSDGKVKNAIYNKRKGRNFCRLCGRAITKYRHKYHDDLCKQCVIDSIEI